MTTVASRCEDLVPCANMTKYPIGVGHTAELALLWNSKARELLKKSYPYA